MYRTRYNLWSAWYLLQALIWVCAWRASAGNVAHAKSWLSWDRNKRQGYKMYVFNMFIITVCFMFSIKYKDVWVKPDGQNSVISFVVSKWLLPELSIPAAGQKDRRLWEREWQGPGFWTTSGNYLVTRPSLRPRSSAFRLGSVNRNLKTSSNHRLGSAGLNALEELLFRCWQ